MYFTNCWNQLMVTFPCVCAKCLVCFYCVTYFYLNTYLLEFFEGWIKSCIPLCWIYIARSMLLKFLENTSNLRNPLKRISHFRVHVNLHHTIMRKLILLSDVQGDFSFLPQLPTVVPQFPDLRNLFLQLKVCSSNHHRGQIP